MAERHDLLKENMERSQQLRLLCMGPDDIGVDRLLQKIGVRKEDPTEEIWTVAVRNMEKAKPKTGRSPLRKLRKAISRKLSASSDGSGTSRPPTPAKAARWRTKLRAGASGAALR